MSRDNRLTLEEKEALLEVLGGRFAKNMYRHEGIEWVDVLKKLEAQDDKLWALNELEKTAGEPDVIAYDKIVDTYLFADCAAESPKERRSLCYDDAALEARKENKPRASAMGMAAAMGVTLLNEVEYRLLQEFGTYDLKSSSWILTPDFVRNEGGAFFCNKRYGMTFLYYNGADAYYGARGFRAKVEV